MENISGRFRKKVYFAQVSNIALRDENLSLKAKGLYALIQSYITLENFDLYKSFLINKSKDGSKAFESGWNELKVFGYLKQYRIRVMTEDINGFIYEYELLDEPNLEQPSLINIGLNGKEVLKNEESIVLPQNGGGTKSDENRTTPQTDVVQNIPCTKRGVSNKTLPTNTYSLNQSIYQDELSITKDDEIDEIDYEKVIAENIDYENLKDTCPKEQVEGIFDLIVDTLHSTKKSVTVDRENIPIERIKKRLLKLNSDHVAYVINSISNVVVPINNINSYTLTCLYNAPTTIGIFYANQANQIVENIRQADG